MLLNYPTNLLPLSGEQTCYQQCRYTLLLLMITALCDWE